MNGIAQAKGTVTTEHLAVDVSATTGSKEAQANSASESAWGNVVETLNTHYHEPDIIAARALYSAVAAHELKGQPVWPLAVAPPSTMKTELIRALDGMPHVHSIDGLTPKTFISGQIREERSPSEPPSSLLHRIGITGI